MAGAPRPDLDPAGPDPPAQGRPGSPGSKPQRPDPELKNDSRVVLDPLPALADVLGRPYKHQCNCYIHQPVISSVPWNVVHNHRILLVNVGDPAVRGQPPRQADLGEAKAPHVLQQHDQRKEPAGLLF